MGLSIASLNSGSNGNCYYIGNDREAVLIDAGISSRETDRRIRRLGLSSHKIKAIFITHEHGDHIKGIRSLVKKYKVPIFITKNTLEYGRIKLKESFIRHFTPYLPVAVGGLSVTAFPKLHDACDPHSFIVTCNRINVGIFTDIGRACNHVVHHFRQCHAAFLEANYDDEMLDKGSYPYVLKNRIRGGHGHLSNREALKLFLDHKAPFMSHLFLSHLSQNNNRPEIVQNLFQPYAGKTEIIIASRFEESAVYDIDTTADISIRPFRSKIKRPSHQLALFN
ncbi:MAG TPA: MBL fold metallo-hydrolase [Chryseolinea sp.]